MPLLKTKVDVYMNFGQISREIDKSASEAVFIGAHEGAKAAAAVASERSKSGRMADMRVSSASRTPDGWQASFTSPVPYAWFQNYGTLGNRRKRLKQAPRTDRTREPGTGIEPLSFLDAGRRVGRKAMLEHIRQGLPG